MKPKSGTDSQRRSLRRPPKIPGEQKAFDRAIMLLGSRAKFEPTPKIQRELEELLGAYPSLEEAVAWKSSLKAIRKQLAAESD